MLIKDLINEVNLLVEAAIEEDDIDRVKEILQDLIGVTQSYDVKSPAASSNGVGERPQRNFQPPLDEKYQKACDYIDLMEEEVGELQTECRKLKQKLTQSEEARDTLRETLNREEEKNRQLEAAAKLENKRHHHRWWNSATTSMNVLNNDHHRNDNNNGTGRRPFTVQSFAVSLRSSKSSRATRRGQFTRFTAPPIEIWQFNDAILGRSTPKNRTVRFEDLQRDSSLKLYSPSSSMAAPLGFLSPLSKPSSPAAAAALPSTAPSLQSWLAPKPPKPKQTPK